ncbi:MAG TPA: TIGR04282 family arsenosugar biosynthesis glycosyltransferase [Ktedonosporobacter sp.]|nr:TIGR04282 family arsenosugar biosynthesis glycosyltransferase [Ktedonosporobacter sp.]
MPGTALVIMTRYPEKGKIKTRLASSIGAEETHQLYQAFLTDLAARFNHGDHALYWAYTPPESDFKTALASFLPPRRVAPLEGARGAEEGVGHCLPQQGGELGERLHNVFLALAKQYQQIIVIASDSPHISLGVIAESQQALQSADVVLGPADDGGYYLIAMREPHDVFSGIPMSTSMVLYQTIESCRRQSLVVQLLEPLFDIDELSDLQRLADLLQHNPTLAPTTAACISTIMKEFV